MLRSPCALFAAAAIITLATSASAANPPPNIRPRLPIGASAQNNKNSNARHCLREGKSKVYLDQLLAGGLNPRGAEHDLAVTFCTPLITEPGILYDFTNIEVGLQNYTSGVYTWLGGFLSIAPLSFLQLRAQFTGIGLWTLPLDGAGHFARKGYSDNFDTTDLPADQAQSTSGSSFMLSASVRGSVPISSNLNVLLSNTVQGENVRFGDDSYYYNLRNDLILAKNDWVFKNTSIVLAEYARGPNLSFMAGLYNEFTLVPASDYKTDLLAAIFIGVLRRPGATIRGLSAFVRPGFYLSHASEKQFRNHEAAVLIGFGAIYELYSSE